jgi:gliding motility-associated lipoprotein GldH
MSCRSSEVDQYCPGGLRFVPTADSLPIFAKIIHLKRLLFLPFILLFCLNFYSCTTIDLYEKSVSIPQHEWKSDFKPSFDFEIKDTLSTYKVFLVLRHTERYSFNNIYVNLSVKAPGQNSIVNIRKDIRLGNNETGWEASGMDDVYEHRSLLAQGERFRAGLYSFTIQQIMREDPLRNVLNVGLRLEKENQ